MCYMQVSTPTLFQKTAQCVKLIVLATHPHFMDIFHNMLRNIFYTICKNCKPRSALFTLSTILSQTVSDKIWMTLFYISCERYTAFHRIHLEYFFNFHLNSLQIQVDFWTNLVFCILEYRKFLALAIHLQLEII